MSLGTEQHPRDGEEEEEEKEEEEGERVWRKARVGVGLFWMRSVDQRLGGKVGCGGGRLDGEFLKTFVSPAALTSFFFVFEMGEQNCEL